MLPSRGDQLVRRRIDVDGGRDPTDGTILCVASPWHSNVPSGKPGGGTARRRHSTTFSFVSSSLPVDVPRNSRPTIDRLLSLPSPSVFSTFCPARYLI